MVKENWSSLCVVCACFFFYFSLQAIFRVCFALPLLFVSLFLWNISSLCFSRQDWEFLIQRKQITHFQLQILCLWYMVHMYVCVCAHITIQWNLNKWQFSFHRNNFAWHSSSGVWHNGTLTFNIIVCMLTSATWNHRNRCEVVFSKEEVKESRSWQCLHHLLSRLYMTSLIRLHSILFWCFGEWEQNPESVWHLICTFNCMMKHHWKQYRDEMSFWFGGVVESSTNTTEREGKWRKSAILGMCVSYSNRTYAVLLHLVYTPVTPSDCAYNLHLVIIHALNHIHSTKMNIWLIESLTIV